MPMPRQLLWELEWIANPHRRLQRPSGYASLQLGGDPPTESGLASARPGPVDDNDSVAGKGWRTPGLPRDSGTPAPSPRPRLDDASGVVRLHPVQTLTASD